MEKKIEQIDIGDTEWELNEMLRKYRPEVIAKILDKIVEIVDYLNTQPQAEENEPDKVYVDPIVPNFTGELSAPVEYKTREEIADSLQAQFEYGRHGTYKDLESARKEFDKERVKEWDRTAMETYKQATQDAPEEWRELFAEWGLWSLVEDISDDGDGYGDNLQLTKEGREAYRMIKGLLDEREREAEKNLLKRFYNATSKEEFRDVLDKLNKKK